MGNSPSTTNNDSTESSNKDDDDHTLPTIILGIVIIVVFVLIYLNYEPDEDELQQSNEIESTSNPLKVNSVTKNVNTTDVIGDFDPFSNGIDAAGKLPPHPLFN